MTCIQLEEQFNWSDFDVISDDLILKLALTIQIDCYNHWKMKQ